MRVSSTQVLSILGFWSPTAVSTFPLPRIPFFQRSTTTMTSAPSESGGSFPTWSFDEPCKSMEWTDLVPAKLELGTVEKADLVIVGVMAPAKADDDEEEDSDDQDPEPVLTGAVKDLDATYQGAIADFMAENSKSFKNGASIGSTSPTFRVLGADGTQRIVLMGLGTKGTADKAKDWTGAGFKLGKAVASRCESEAKLKSVQVVLPSDVTANATIVQDFSSSFYQTLYADNRYRTGKKVKKLVEKLESVTISCSDDVPFADSSSVEYGRLLARGVTLAKDIVNAPHNVLNSESLAETAKRIAAESNGAIECQILDKAECEKRGMGAYLGVARGSETEPQFIHLTYKGSGTNLKKVGVIGKGLLFDTGGYNIKTAMMELMKFDCGGSAAVLGAARAIGDLKPEGVEAHFVVAACENMINQKAVVPSDILTASNGKTIEVLNTDAEGRLTLADALVYLDKEIDCDKIIELSTLTGACMVSLGKEIAGVWTNDDDMAEELNEIATATGDNAWRMPMAKEYNKQLESKIADIKNIGGRYGGAITAALFLQNFVTPKKPFAHIDIAGPVWSDETGATGFGAKMVTEWVTRQGKN